ncbi:MAG: hypothetical protein J3K34DRAFT_521244 [Monoraphidium minutum]|nr:MAG: hypothetical protein J3K34DRAFT_521244 [Monoraphidium minutum]
MGNSPSIAMCILLAANQQDPSNSVLRRIESCDVEGEAFPPFEPPGCSDSSYSNYFYATTDGGYTVPVASCKQYCWATPGCTSYAILRNPCHANRDPSDARDCCKGGGGGDFILNGDTSNVTDCHWLANNAPAGGTTYVSEPGTDMQSPLDRVAGPDAWPAAGTWVTALGLRSAAGAGMAVELRMRKDTEHALVQDGAKTRALRPAGAPAGAAGLRSLLAAASVNGADVLGRVGSGETLDLGAAGSVHFPATAHAADAADGPVMVITTPATVWTWFLESEDTWHLDFKVQLRPGSTITRMHGLLGQSLHWAAGAPAAVEGGDDMLYAVKDGLLGTDTRFRLFGKEDRAAADGRRALKAAAAAPAAAGLTAGSVA